jgi:transposase-like protein
VSRRYQRTEQRTDYRNGYYWRSFVTRFGVLRLRIARSRKRGFPPEVMKKFQRRAEEVTVMTNAALCHQNADFVTTIRHYYKNVDLMMNESR